MKFLILLSAVLALSELHTAASSSGYSLIASNGYCKHVDGDWLLTCTDYGVTSISSCEEKCTNRTSCVGYTYMAAANTCLLYPSDGTCPICSSCNPEYSGKLAETINDLVPASEIVPESDCYGKTYEICYQPDAEIKNAEWQPPTSHPDEDLVKAECSMNVNCLGYWKRTNNPETGNPEYGSLVAGTRTWVKDKQPNTNVKGVWKKSSDCLPGCGDILREDTSTKRHGSVPNGWILCYIDSRRDSRYKRTQCRDLIKNIQGFSSYQKLLAAGGNFGCWHGRRGAKEGAAYATNNVVQHSCRNNVQQTTTLEAWKGSNVVLGVCIKLP